LTVGLLNDANLSLAEGIVRAWIKANGDRGFPVAPDYLLALVVECRSGRTASLSTTPSITGE